MPKSGRDPSLDIFLKARGKNNVAETRLRKSLSNLESERQNKQLLHNIDLYEQRRLAYEYEREVTDIQFKNDALESYQEVPRQGIGVVDSAKSRKGVQYPIGGEPFPKIPLSSASKRGETVRSGRREQSQLHLPNVASPTVRENTDIKSTRGRIDTEQVEFPKLRVLLRSEIGPRESTKSGKCSTNTAQREQLPGINTREATVVHGMSLGNPRAIKSVRRTKREASDLMTTRKCHEEERKLLREMSSSSLCSKSGVRNWQIKELEKTYSSVPTLMPALEKLRDDLRKSQISIAPVDYTKTISTFKLRRCMSDRNVSRPNWKFPNSRGSNSFRGGILAEKREENMSTKPKLTESMPELNHI